MSLDPGFRRVYSNDTYQDVYKTTVVNTALESDGERGSSGIKARGWSLLTMVWSAVASPINMIRHIGSALLFGSFNLLRGDVAQAKKEFLNHSFKALDSAARLVGGTVLGAVGIAMPETAAKANFAFNRTLGNTLGEETCIVASSNLNVIKNQLQIVCREHPNFKTSSVYLYATRSDEAKNETTRATEMALLEKLVPRKEVEGMLEAAKKEAAQQVENKKASYTNDLTKWIEEQFTQTKAGSNNFPAEICNEKGELDPSKLEYSILQYFDNKKLDGSLSEGLAEAFASDETLLKIIKSKLSAIALTKSD